MKRYVVGTLLVSIVMFVQLFGDVPVFADTFVPTSSYDFIGLSDLGYALVGGAEFDFEGSPYVIDDYNSLSSEQKEIQKSLKAREFLNDYLESRGIAFEENGELQKGSAYYTIAFGLAGQEFFEAFQTATAAEQEDLEYQMPISPSRYADWAQYNKYWFNKYASDFYSQEDTITVNPDPNYLTYLDTINGLTIQSNLRYNFLANNFVESDFWPYVPTNTPLEFVNGTYYHADYGGYSFISENPLNGQIAFFQDVLDVRIDSSTLSYIVSQGALWYPFESSNNSSIKYCTAVNMRYKPADNAYASDWWKQGPDSPIYYSFSGFSTLSQVFDSIQKYWKNVNIYVDGEAWSLVSNPSPANPSIPDFPDIINQENGELAYDITMPKTSDYSGSFDLTSLFDAIREGIAGASDGDLATGSTIGSLDVGRTYTGEGIDINDRVIDLTSSRVFDGTLTDDTTGRLPKPPVVPPAVSAGLGGVTVLAKYVDATQCILPDELMTAFWGCVWILIMLGLIKNLHR